MPVLSRTATLRAPDTPPRSNAFIAIPSLIQSPEHREKSSRSFIPLIRGGERYYAYPLTDSTVTSHRCQSGMRPLRQTGLGHEITSLLRRRRLSGEPHYQESGVIMTSRLWSGRRHALEKPSANYCRHSASGRCDHFGRLAGDKDDRHPIV